MYIYIYMFYNLMREPPIHVHHGQFLVRLVDDVVEPDGQVQVGGEAVDGRGGGPRGVLDLR